jgi:hypothetical protein
MQNSAFYENEQEYLSYSTRFAKKPTVIDSLQTRVQWGTYHMVQSWAGAKSTFKRLYHRQFHVLHF